MNESYSYTHCAFGVAGRDVTAPAGSTRAGGAPRRTTRGRGAPAADGAPPPSSRRSEAKGRNWRSSRSTRLVQYAPDGQAVIAAVMERTGLGEAEILIQMSHTHAGANTNPASRASPAQS